MTRKVLLIKSTGIFEVYRIFFYLYFYGVSFAKEWILRQLAGPPATQLELWTRWKWYLLPYWGDQKETRLFLVVGSLQVKKPVSFTMESLFFYNNVLLLSQLDVDALVVFSLTLSLRNVAKGKFRPKSCSTRSFEVSSLIYIIAWRGHVPVSLCPVFLYNALYFTHYI